MAVYTHLGAGALAELIACYEVGELVSAKGIAEGISNSNWLVETTGHAGSGTRFILTMYERRIELADLPFLGTVLRLGLNEITAAMLAAGLVLHGSPRRFVRAVELAAGACAGVLIQFPIYAAIIGVMVGSGLARALAEVSAGVGPGLLPVSTMWSAAVLNLFVPSGGGQWAVQGPIALEAGLAAGVEPGRMILAVAYGDQLTNMLQPFWALPLLAITGVRAGEMVGYTCLVMLAGAAWMSLWLAVL
ncbi:TIGR00366 family protein [Leptolyngbya sp. 15MV]|nr:TIGR00366 family protein [Leptolyngbya sp. 15MV]